MSSSEHTNEAHQRSIPAEKDQVNQIQGSPSVDPKKGTSVADRKMLGRNADERMRFMAQKPQSRSEVEIAEKELAESSKKGSKDKKAVDGEPLNERIYNAEGGAIKHKKRDMAHFSPAGTTLEAYRMHQNHLGEMDELDQSGLDDSFEMRSDSLDDTSSGQFQPGQTCLQSVQKSSRSTGTVAGRHLQKNAARDSTLHQSPSSTSRMPPSNVLAAPKSHHPEEESADRRRMDRMEDFRRQSPHHEPQFPASNLHSTSFDREQEDGRLMRGGREVDDEEFYTRQSYPRDPSLMASRDPSHFIQYHREDFGLRRDRSSYERSRYGPLPKLMTYRITNKSAYMPSGYAKEDEIDYSTGEYRPKRNLESVTSPCPRVSSHSSCEPKEFDAGRYIDSDHVQHLNERGCPPTSY